MSSVFRFLVGLICNMMCDRKFQYFYLKGGVVAVIYRVAGNIP